MLLASTALVVEASIVLRCCAAQAQEIRAATTAGTDASAVEELASVSAVVAACVDGNGIVGGSDVIFGWSSTKNFRENYCIVRTRTLYLNNRREFSTNLDFWLILAKIVDVLGPQR